LQRRRERGPGAAPWAAALMAAAGLLALLVLATVAGSPTPRGPVARGPKPAPAVIGERATPRPELPPAQERTKRIEAEVKAIEQEQRVLEQARKEAEEARREELLRQAESELARVAAKYREKVEELERARREEQKAPTVAAPQAVARIERAEGAVFLLTDAGRSPARAGQGLLAGQTIETAGATSSAAVAFADGTRVEWAGATEVQEGGGPRGKRLTIARGTVTAVVTKQPYGQPMVFATPHGEAVVLGTTLRLAVDALSTRLDVREGRVRFVRTEDRASVEVASDHFATVTKGMSMAPRPMPIDEIVLLPREVRTAGPDWWGVRVLPKPAVTVRTDWRVVTDGKAVSGSAFEAPLVWNGSDTATRLQSKRLMQSYVEFTFRADADKDYHVWVRGRPMDTTGAAGSGKEWYKFDLLGVEPLNADATSKHLPTLEGRAYEFNGFGQKDGYWWISGNCDPADLAMPRGFPTNPPPVTVRFQRTGTQVLRVYPIQTPMRFDAVWLSATQKTRPADNHRGLEAPKK
ncbi:MAG: FecR domain-containing protein, partial [Thermoanaerobaculia bacterium]